MRPLRSLVASLGLIGLCLIHGVVAAEPPSDAYALRHPTPVDVPDWADRGVAWLIAAQHQDGGWGADSQAARSGSRIRTQGRPLALRALAAALTP